MLILNRHPEYGLPLDHSHAALFDREAALVAREYLTRSWGAVPHTPLRSIDAVARELGVKSVHVKDESERLGLGSFKALGGSYAVMRLSGTANDNAATFACATDGNHGKSVAAGARNVGAKAVIFMHSGVNPKRVQAVEALGARVIRVPGTYDDSVREAARVSHENGWQVISDTSWEGYEQIPLWVMQGYTVMLEEAREQMSEPPTHVFIQAGVGGLAASVAAYYGILPNRERPFITVVDPERAACVFESARSGRAASVPAGEPTVMALLECYEASPVAWRILSRAADAFMTIRDEEATQAMKWLAPEISTSESGSAGLAGLIAAAKSDDHRQQLRLTADSRVMVINTEGALR
jgi:diaminopropionate ammonia-lyase